MSQDCDCSTGRSKAYVALAVCLLLGAGCIIAYGLGFRQGAVIQAGEARVELRYDVETGWFEVWENGELRSEWAADELLLEEVPNPPGRRPPRFTTQ